MITKHFFPALHIVISLCVHRIQYIKNWHAQIALEIIEYAAEKKTF